MNKPAVIVSALGIAAFGLPILTAVAQETAVPLPFARPNAPVAFPATAPAPMLPPGRAMSEQEITGAIPRAGGLVSSPALKAGLDAISSRDLAGALAARSGLPAGSLDAKILTWAIATSNLADLPSGEILAAQQQLKSWPGLYSLRAPLERALYRENAAPAQVLAAMGSAKPSTTEGAIILARSLRATGKTAEASRSLRNLWSEEALDKSTEDKILAEFASLLNVADHRARMDNLMYRGRGAQAKRFAELGQADPLYKAWIAVNTNAKTAPAAIAAASAGFANDPALLFVRIESLRKQEKYAEAAQLLQRMPRDTARLVNAGEWWNEQRIVARGLADQGDWKPAYQLSANSVTSSSTDKVDAEFHAGWYALRALQNPAQAEIHFRRILDASTRPLSASRAWYWLGRAAEEGGPGAARDFYAKAAGYPGTFYGQLAAARLGTKTIDVSYPSPTAADRQSFASREVVLAMARLDDLGHDRRSAALYKALGEELTSPGELALLCAKAEAQGDHALSLQIGKSAFSRGIDVAALAFPLGVIPTGADIGGSGKALAYAIARQESAFNPAAVSAANARGLLQILPTTAQGVAKRHGISYKADRLTTDAGYNATLGAHYLGEQIDTFGGSYIMTFIAYNAGPRRVNDWIARYGDPRGKPIDEVVDWIERIPFPETRNYVQRVMENYQVYKTRLGQRSDIVDDLRFGRQ